MWLRLIRRQTQGNEVLVTDHAATKFAMEPICKLLGRLQAAPAGNQLLLVASARRASPDYGKDLYQYFSHGMDLHEAEHVENRDDNVGWMCVLSFQRLCMEDNRFVKISQVLHALAYIRQEITDHFNGGGPETNMRVVWNRIHDPRISLWSVRVSDDYGKPLRPNR